MAVLVASLAEVGARWVAGFNKLLLPHLHMPCRKRQENLEPATTRVASNFQSNLTQTAIVSPLARYLGVKTCPCRRAV